MNSLNIGICQLKINIQSLIPKNKNQPLTSDMLDYTGGASLEKYPFFSEVHKYPRKDLQKLSYNKIIEFFFVLEVFRNKLKKRKVTRNKYNENRKNKKNVTKKMKFKGGGKVLYETPAQLLKLKQSNFVLMLQLLFPTVYPTVNNIDTSIGIIMEQEDESLAEINKEDNDANEEKTNEQTEEDEFKTPNTNKPDTQNESNIDITSRLFDFKNIQSFFSLKGTNIVPLWLNKFSKKFSYLKIDNTYYTITRTIWLNDVMNHPVYSEIINTFYAFDIWKSVKLEIQDDKEKWNIVLFFFEACIKNKVFFEDVANDLNAFLVPYKTNNVYRSQNLSPVEIANIDKFVILMKYFFNDTDKTRNPNLEFIDENINKDDTTKNKYEQRRKILFETFKQEKTNDDNMYNKIDQLVTLFNKIQNTNSINDNLRRFLKYDLKTKIDNYKENKKYEGYVNNLDFEYLVDKNKDSNATDTSTSVSKIGSIIRSKYPEFNNFVTQIEKMKSRVIDNKVWDTVIKSIIKGSKYHNFETKIWDKIDGCYGLTDEVEQDVDSDEELEDTKVGGESDKPFQKGGSGCTLNEPVFYVNFDQIKDKDETKLPNFKLIEVYLQMDFIQGKYDESNIDTIKCDYTDSELGNTWDKLTNGVHAWDLTNQMILYVPTKDKKDKTSVIESKPEPEKKKLEKPVETVPKKEE